MAARIPGTENDIRQTRADMAFPLEQIAVPTLVVHGTNDSVVPFAQAKALAGRVRRTEMVAIEGGEHASIFTHRVEVRARIDHFFGGCGM